jgi:hypothetical protein
VAVSPPLELPRGIAPDVEMVRVQTGVAVGGELDLNHSVARHPQIADRARAADGWHIHRAGGMAIGNLSGLESRPNSFAERRVARCAFAPRSAPGRAATLV